MIAHINIGSNLGHRAEILSRAVTLLSERVGKVLAVSNPVETWPDGFDSPNLFLNIGVNVETDLTPSRIVAALGEIELLIDPETCHRTASGEYCDRKIDLDLICLGQTVSTDSDAMVPHPRMHQRDFVVIPLMELLPDWTHPLLLLKPSEIYKRITDSKQ